MKLRLWGVFVLLGFLGGCADSPVTKPRGSRSDREVVYKKVWSKDSLSPARQVLGTLAKGENPNTEVLPPKNPWEEFDEEIKLTSPREESMNVRNIIDPQMDNEYPDSML